MVYDSNKHNIIEPTRWSTQEINRYYNNSY